MKKLLSLALCCVIAASSLASCAQSAAKNYSPKITVSSSEAEESALYLTNRLGENLTDSVYITVGTSDGVDMTDFEDDGYIVRVEDGCALIAGKTAAGLNAAARKYANAVEKNESDGLSAVYHEGSRVDKFTIAGNDISEYAIEYPAENNENMLFAVSEFTQLLKKACGVDLPASEGITNRRCAVEFRFTDDEGLRDDGYKYYIEGSRLVIEGAAARGCMYGVYRFFEKEFEWKMLIVGLSVLPESDLIALEDGLFVTETPMCDFYNQMLSSYGLIYQGTSRNERTEATTAQLSYGPVKAANHGLQKNNEWLQSHSPSIHVPQICYTDEDIRLTLCDSLTEYIDGLLASGRVIGESLKSIDISQGDNAWYCHCTNCMKVYLEEGGAVSGAVVRWANEVEETMSENYDGLKYLIFAYHGTQPACKTAPNENVYVTYCTDGGCSAHPMTGRKCTDKRSAYGLSDDPLYNNIDFDRWLEEWCALSDNIYVWDYDMGNFQPYVIIDQLYEEFQRYRELGVRGLYWMRHWARFGTELIEIAMAEELMWNPDMTREEYGELASRYFELEYGEGYRYIEEYTEMRLEAQKGVGCWDSWGYSDVTTDTLNPYYFIENADRMEELLERAVHLAETDLQRTQCELLTVAMYYGVCYSEYFKAYDDGNTARIAELSEKYDLMISRLKSNGYSIKNIKVMGNTAVSISETLEKEAWSNWKSARRNLHQGETVRPAP